MSIFNFFNKKSNEKCRKTKWGKGCNSYRYLDELNNREWSYCVEHGCWICANEIQKRLGGGEKFGKAGFFLCHRAECKETANNNLEAIKKVCQENAVILGAIFKGDFYLASDLVLKDLIGELEKIEVEAVTYNISKEVVINPQYLEVIKATIDAKNKAILSLAEKESLKSAYINGKGKLNNILHEKLTTFLAIMEARAEKRDQKNKTQQLENSRKDFIESLKNLEGYDLLSESQLSYFSGEVNRLEPSQFSVVLGEVKKTIERLRKMSNEERERERERAKNENLNLPPQEKNSDQPGPNNPSHQSPSPRSPNSPSGLSQELEQIKQRIKSTYNLTTEEFDTIITPLNDQELLEHVSRLLGKVKEFKGGKITDTDTCLEFLLSYCNAASNSNKKRAYEAVNSYQQQVDKIITDLQNKKWFINASLTELVQAKSEEKLNSIYQEIQKNSELYQGKNRKTIDNHEQRVSVAIKIESKFQNLKSSDYEKQLAAKLRTIINSDTDKSALEELQKKLNEFKSTSEVRKKTVYDNYCEAIDLMLKEVKEELLRRKQTEKEQESTLFGNKKISPKNKKSVIPTVIIVVGIVIILLAFSLLVAFQYRKRRKIKK